jgi:hypothetical protein
MTVNTFSSRDFTRDVSAAEGPVFITDRGRPAFALLKIEDCYRLAGDTSRSLLDAMDSVSGGDFDFEPPRLQGKPKPAKLARRTAVPARCTCWTPTLFPSCAAASAANPLRCATGRRPRSCAPGSMRCWPRLRRSGAVVRCDDGNALRTAARAGPCIVSRLDDRGNSA